MIVGLQILFLLIRKRRIKNPFYSLMHKICDMSVYQLGRIADGLGGNRFHSLRKQRFAAWIGKNHAEAKLRKKRKPERIVFI